MLILLFITFLQNVVVKRRFIFSASLSKQESIWRFMLGTETVKLKQATFEGKVFIVYL